MVTIEKVMRIDNVPYKKWEQLEEILSENGIWFEITNNPDGYNLVDCGGDNPIPFFIELEVITQEEANIINEYQPETLIVVFD